LEYADLIERDGGMVRVAGLLDPPPFTPATPEKPLANRDENSGTTKLGAKTPEAGTQVIGFNFAFSLTVDDLAKLTPEQITATFEAVGKVMAIKAAIQQD
jgi:hypothetical protein